MKRSLLTTILAIFLIAIASQPTYAGFATPKTNAVTTVVDPAETKQTVNDKTQSVIASIKSHVKSIFPAHHKREEKSKKPAWQSIASLGCSTLGFIMMVAGFASVISAIGWTAFASVAVVFGLMCGIAGLIFGIMGLKKRKHKFRGFAMAGLILGCVDIFFLCVVALLAVALSV